MEGTIDQVSLSLYCPGCLPGYHLPVFAGVAGGRFADHGLQVKLVHPWPGFENVRHVGAGDADFCLTSVAHFMRAHAEDGQVRARFVAVVMQRTPVAALVTSEGIRRPEDLAGRRLGGRADGGFVAMLQAALVDRGIAPMRVVPLDQADAETALARGEVDAVAELADVVPQVRRRVGADVRAVAVPVLVYANGLVANDDVDGEVAARLRRALTGCLDGQRDDPNAGLDALLTGFPDVDPDDALEGWKIAERSIFTDQPTGSMDADRWAQTTAFIARTHSLPEPAGNQVFRDGFALPDEGSTMLGPVAARSD